MIGLAILSLVLLGFLEFGNLSPQTDELLLYADLLIVAIFWVEYAYRWTAATDRRKFLATTWYEIPGMVPIFPGMQQFAGVRLFRLLRVFRVLRLLGALRRIERFERFVQHFTKRSKLGYVALIAAVLIVVDATIVWALDPAIFPSYWDALWWGMVTVTTVGYGDYAPTQGWARVAALPLMVLGVGLIATVAGTLSSFLVERQWQGEHEKSQTEGKAPSSPIPVPQLAHELERLARLHESGALSDEEFRLAKQALLGGALSAPAPKAPEP